MYKRQVIGAAIAIFAVKDLDFYEDVLQSTARADPVSYTHLDVYKRQR